MEFLPAAICLGSGAATGAAMLASKEFQKKRREAFMRKGDQILQQLLANPEQLVTLKRLIKVPDEAPVWFIIAHVGVAHVEGEQDGQRLCVKIKHGGQGWSVIRQTDETTAVRLPKDQIQQLRDGHKEKRQLREAAREAQAQLAASLPPPRRKNRFPPDTTPEMTSNAIENAMEELPCVADFNSTLLFVCSNMSHFRGLRPCFRLRLMQQRHRGAGWKNVGWGAVPLTVEAGTAAIQELEAPFFPSKESSKTAAVAEAPNGIVDMVIETRPIRMGDLRKHGLNLGKIVYAPLPGQESHAYVQGVPVQGALKTAAGDHGVPPGLAEALARRRRFRNNQITQEESDSSALNSGSECEESESEASESVGSTTDSGTCSSSDESSSPTKGCRLRVPRVCTCR